MWVTMRKRSPGWFARLAANPPQASARVLNIENTITGNPVISTSGRFAGMTLLIEQLPVDCDLNQINIEIEGEEAAPIYIGPSVWDGITKVNALLPPKVRTGLGSRQCAVVRPSALGDCSGRA